MGTSFQPAERDEKTGPPREKRFTIKSLKTLSLWQKVALIVALLVTLVLLTAGVAAYAAFRSQLSDHLTQSLTLQADRIARETEARLSGILVSMDELANNTLIANSITDTAGRDAYLDPFLEGLDSMNGVPIDMILVDFRNRPIASNNTDAIAKLRAVTALSEQAIQTGTFQGHVIDVDGHPYFVGVEPLVFPRISSVEGALVYRFPIPGWQANSRYETESLSFSLSFSPNTAFPGELQSTDPSAKDDALNSQVWPPLPVDQATVFSAELPLRLPDEHNIGDFRVGAHAGTSVINQPIAEITAIFIALAMVLLPLTVFGSILLTRRTLAPLRELADLSRDIAEHKTMLRRLTHAGDDELGQVASAFNHMIDELKSHQTNLEALVDRQTQSLQLEIKERKDAEKALIEAKNQSELASRAKSELIANMSHELRTPLNAVIGFSESLLYGVKGPLASEDQAAYVRLIQESGTHLLSLINDILDVSAIEAGKLQIDEDWHSIKPIIDSVCLLVGARARDGDVTLHNQAQDTLPLLLCDERRIKQVLLNILSNAIKFTPAQGTITLSTELRRDGLLIQIADTGIGMDESQLEVAMSVFGQVDSGLNRKSEGTGLGLPLTKSLVDMHHSQLLITSTPGVGTTVGVLFPCERLRQAPQDSLSTVRLA